MAPKRFYGWILIILAGLDGAEDSGDLWKFGTKFLQMRLPERSILLLGDEKIYENSAIFSALAQQQIFPKAFMGIGIVHGHFRVLHNFFSAIFDPIEFFRNEKTVGNRLHQVPFAFRMKAEAWIFVIKYFFSTGCGFHLHTFIAIGKFHA